MAAEQLISTDRTRALVGLGVSGRSVARYLQAEGKPFTAFDTRDASPAIEQFREENPGVEIQVGALSSDVFLGCDEIILSPGVSPHEPLFAALEKQGVALVGDIELFARDVDKPVVAITGANAKSTVTALVGLMAERSGLKVGVGGNMAP